MLTVLGTAAQVPTSERNHVGLFLRWDRHGFLFDPGEGTQRQMVRAGVSASDITKIFISHFHGDHCLGLSGVIQRLSLQRVEHTVEIYYPSKGRIYLDRLLHCVPYYQAVELKPIPVEAEGTVCTEEDLAVSAARLDHGSQTFGYRVQEHSGRTIHPELLPPEVSGRRIGELKRKGSIQTENGVLALEDVSTFKPGQSFVCLLDTRLCQGAETLARDATLLLSEATYLDSEAELARDYRHLTAAQAAQLASRAGAGKLVLVHYSQRYKSLSPFDKEAKAHHPDILAARDGDVIPLPRLERKLSDRSCPDSAEA